MRKTGCSRVSPPRPLASARASVAACPSTTRSRSVRSSTRSSRRSRTRPPTAATGSPSASPCAPAAPEDLPRPPRQPVQLASDGEGQPDRRSGLAEDDALGSSGSSDEEKGPVRSEAMPDRHLGRRRGLDRHVPEDGRDRRPAETESEGARERFPRCGGPRRADADDDEPRALAVRQTSGQGHGEAGRDDHEVPVHQAGRAGIDLRVARAADGHGGAPAHLARRLPGRPLGPTPHARGWNVR